MSIKKRFFTLPITAIVIFLVSIMPIASNAATTVYNNLSNGGTPYAFGYAQGSQSNSFTSPNSANLLEVTLKLSGDGATGGTLSVNLVSDNGSNEPDLINPVISVLGTIAEDTLALSLTNYTFNSFTPVSLTGGTRYWINVVSSLGGGSASWWGYADDNTGIGTALEFSSNPTDGTVANGFPYQMQVQVSDANNAVPEPTTLALLSVGLVGIGFGKRRKVS